VAQYGKQEVAQRMSMLMESSGEIIQQYADAQIELLHDSLERSNDFAEIRFIQGQIAGIRDFCSFVQE